MNSEITIIFYQAK